MKTVNTVLKVLAALAAVAGAVYVIATYGDRIVAWAKKVMENCPCHKCKCAIDAPEEEAAPEDFAEEAPAEEPAPEEDPAAEEAPDEDAPTADEADFEG